MENDKLNYTIINHAARAALGIGYTEYAVADIIYNFSSRPGANGWCSVSKEWIGEQFGVSKKRISNIISLLKKNGIVEGKETIVNKSRGEALKTTTLWYETAVISKKGGNFSGQESQKVGTFREKVGTFRDKGGNFSGLKPGYDNEYNKDNTNNTRINENPSGSIGEKENVAAENAIGSLDNVREILEHYKKCSGVNARETDGKIAKTRTRLQSFSKEEIKQAISNAFEDDFYGGRKTHWKADFDYIFRSDDTMDKMLNLKPKRSEDVSKVSIHT